MSFFGFFVIWMIAFFFGYAMGRMSKDDDPYEREEEEELDEMIANDPNAKFYLVSIFD